MINNINDPKIYRFKHNVILIVEQSEKMHLVGPGLSDLQEISPAEGYIFHLVKELGAFKITDVLELFIKQQKKQRPEDPLFILKTLNKFLIKDAITSDEEASENIDTIPKFEIEYSFEDEKQNTYKLVAHTFSNRIAYHWALSLNYQLRFHPELFHNGLFYGNSFNSIEDCFNQLEGLIKPINTALKKYLGDDEIKSIWPKAEKNRDYLWKLHQVFEDFYPRFLAPEFFNKNEEIKELCQNFKLLNYMIHMTEDALENWKGGFIEVIFDHHTKPTPLGTSKEVDSLFSPNFEEKTIYLNYFQVGYSFLAAHDAGTDSTPVPQKDFCANHFLYLRPMNKFTDEKRKQVERWLHEKHGKDINDSSLRLGHIPLAKIEGPEDYRELNQRLKLFQNLRKIQIRSI